MKQTIRATTGHQEINSKRQREKIAKLENELVSKRGECERQKNKIQVQKQQVAKLMGAEKTLRGLLLHKEDD